MTAGTSVHTRAELIGLHSLRATSRDAAQAVAQVFEADAAGQTPPRSSPPPRTSPRSSRCSTRIRCCARSSPGRRVPAGSRRRSCSRSSAARSARSQSTSSLPPLVSAGHRHRTSVRHCGARTRWSCSPRPSGTVPSNRSRTNFPGFATPRRQSAARFAAVGSHPRRR